MIANVWYHISSFIYLIIYTEDSGHQSNHQRSNQNCSSSSIIGNVVICFVLFFLFGLAYILTINALFWPHPNSDFQYSLLLYVGYICYVHSELLHYMFIYLFVSIKEEKILCCHPRHSYISCIQFFFSFPHAITRGK